MVLVTCLVILAPAAGEIQQVQALSGVGGGACIGSVDEESVRGLDAEGYIANTFRGHGACCYGCSVAMGADFQKNTYVLCMVCNLRIYFIKNA